MVQDDEAYEVRTQGEKRPDLFLFVYASRELAKALVRRNDLIQHHLAQAFRETGHPSRRTLVRTRSAGKNLCAALFQLNRNKEFQRKEENPTIDLCSTEKGKDNNLLLRFWHGASDLRPAEPAAFEDVKSSS
ncbi:MAG TPA: hypothetical protein VFI27_06890 [candidate division Zixibacteria bacterium]|nr:hypothetical protein [candidate division Zixibacteria bacterium]